MKMSKVLCLTRALLGCGSIAIYTLEFVIFNSSVFFKIIVQLNILSCGGICKFYQTQDLYRCVYVSRVVRMCKCECVYE